MYDKVRFWVDRTVIGEQYAEVVNYLENPKQEIDLETGHIRAFGNLGGMKVSVYINGLSIVGSLPKFLYGSNVYPLNRKDTKQAIEKISDTLHLPVSDAIIRELEFGTNFLMKYPVAQYLEKLGNMPRLGRYHFEPSTLYYKGKGRQPVKTLAFYDKIADAETKGLEYPKNLIGANLLKYEMRLKGKLPQILNVSSVEASTLYDNGFYKMMVKRYQDGYFSISKLNQVKTNIMAEIKTVTDAIDVFVARLISQGGETQIIDFLNELKGANVFDDKKYYTRVKKRLQEVSCKANITISDELIKELDDEIKNVGAYV